MWSLTRKSYVNSNYSRILNCTVTSTWVGADYPGECHLARLGIPCPKEAHRLNYGTSRSSVYDAVIEQNQDGDLRPFSSGGQN